MTGTVESPSQRFTNHYKESFPPSIVLDVGRKREPLTATTAKPFRDSRTFLLDRYLHGNSRKGEMTEGHLAEQMVNLALRPMLSPAGFSSRLAPESLEHGNDQKGVDILITNPRNKVFLGIDVKLRRGKSRYQRDGFGWSPKMRSPFIYLSLGNWAGPPNSHGNEISIKEWLKNQSKNGIIKSGQIPYLDALRRYLAVRIERTLEHAHAATREPQIFPHTHMLPEGTRDLTIMREKIGVMHHLFTALQDAA